MKLIVVIVRVIVTGRCSIKNNSNNNNNHDIAIIITIIIIIIFGLVEAVREVVGVCEAREPSLGAVNIV